MIIPYCLENKLYMLHHKLPSTGQSQNKCDSDPLAVLYLSHMAETEANILLSLVLE